MEKLVYISLAQKHPRYLQNSRRLREEILPFVSHGDELRHYLQNEESVFFEEFCEKAATLKMEKDELQKLILQGIQFTYIGHESYPEQFRGMCSAPMMLSYQGHATWQWAKGLSVVGSRDACSLSHLWMEDHLAEFLKQEAACIVSGGARGVDQAAHQLALRHERPTMILLPSGLGEVYPNTLLKWQTRVIDGGGCLLSEYAYTEKMRKHFFHDRNRLIAGFGVMTLLIEARRRSGSLLTAHQTLQMGKPVLVVPGHPCDPSHLGNLDLLSEGATPVRDAQDLCMYFRSELRTPSMLLPMASRGLH